ncbi:hypothetical protein [Streptomyces sp. NPDC055749]
MRKAYGDKLPGSGYARSGKAGGYAPGTDVASGRPAAAAAVASTHDTALTVTSSVAGAGALLVLVSWAFTAVRRDRRRRGTPATGA